MFLGTLLHRIFEASLIAKGKCVRGFSSQTSFNPRSIEQNLILSYLIKCFYATFVLLVDFSAKFVLNHTKQLLQQPPNLTELYGLGITEDEVLTKVSEFTPFLVEWGTKYFVAKPHPIHGVIDFKEGGVSKSMDNSRAALCVSQVLDIEECVWSPKFGLKGKD